MDKKLEKITEKMNELAAMVVEYNAGLECESKLNYVEISEWGEFMSILKRDLPLTSDYKDHSDNMVMLYKMMNGVRLWMLKDRNDVLKAHQEVEENGKND